MGRNFRSRIFLKAFILLTAIGFAVDSFTPAWGNVYRAFDLTVYLDNQEFSFRDKGAFTDWEGRAYIPLREMIEGLGGEVEWIESQPGYNQAVVSMGQNQVRLAPGSHVVMVNDEVTVLSEPIALTEDRLVAPLTFFAEIGHRVIRIDDVAVITSI